MDKRHAARRDVVSLQEALTRALLILPDNHEIESCVIDISSQGLKVSILPSAVSLSIPRKNEIVAVIFKAIPLQLACKCIYSMYCQDGSMLIGFFVFDLDGQKKLLYLLDEIE